ncbi:MAG: spermidine synthase, partial [Spirochaetia bacterium]
MTKLFEELDHSHTSLGELILRRRRYVGLDAEVYEVKLGGDFLMSSLFTTSEEALGRLGVQHARRNRAAGAGRHRAAAGDRSAAGDRGGGPDVVVGGLGLGYTAA